MWNPRSLEKMINTFKHFAPINQQEIMSELSPEEKRKHVIDALERKIKEDVDSVELGVVVSIPMQVYARYNGVKIILNNGEYNRLEKDRRAEIAAKNTVQQQEEVDKLYELLECENTVPGEQE